MIDRPWLSDRQRHQQLTGFLLDAFEEETGIDADRLDPSRRERRIVRALAEDPSRINEFFPREAPDGDR